MLLLTLKPSGFCNVGGNLQSLRSAIFRRNPLPHFVEGLKTHPHLGLGRGQRSSIEGFGIEHQAAAYCTESRKTAIRANARVADNAVVDMGTALHRLTVYRESFFQFLQHLHRLHGVERGVIDIAGGEAESFIFCLN